MAAAKADWDTLLLQSEDLVLRVRSRPSPGRLPAVLSTSSLLPPRLPAQPQPPSGQQRTAAGMLAPGDWLRAPPPSRRRCRLLRTPSPVPAASQSKWPSHAAGEPGLPPCGARRAAGGAVLGQAAGQGHARGRHERGPGRQPAAGAGGAQPAQVGDALSCAALRWRCAAAHLCTTAAARLVNQSSGGPRRLPQPRRPPQRGHTQHPAHLASPVRPPAG